MRAVAVIGCGSFGPHLVRNLSEAGVPTVFVVDPHPERVRQVCDAVAGAYPLPDLTALWQEESVQAVVIATPIPSHAGLVRPALDQGRHVLVEKPLATSASEADALVELANREGLLLAVDHTALFEPGWAEVAQRIRDAGPTELTLERGGPGGFRDDTDVLWDLAPHDLALVDDLLDTPPGWIRATGQTSGETLVEAQLELGGAGTTVSVALSWRASERRRRVHAVCGEQTFDFDALAPRPGATEPLRGVIDDFLAAVEHGRSPRVDGRAAARVVRWIECAHTSLERGGARVALD